MRISIFGRGYVAAVCATCLIEQGHGIAGVDVSELKVGLINGGKSPAAGPESASGKVTGNDPGLAGREACR